MNFNHLCTHSLLPHDIGITYLAYMMNICGTSWAWLPDQILLWKLPWIPLKSSEWWIGSCGKFSLWLNMPCPPITKLSSLLFKGIQFKFQDLWLGKSKLITDFFFSVYVLQYYHQVKPWFTSWLRKQFEFFQFLLKTSAAFLGFALSQLIARTGFIFALQTSQLRI